MNPPMTHTDGKKYTLTDHQITVIHGGHGVPSVNPDQPIKAGDRSLGHQAHYPVFLGEDGFEYICKDGYNFIRLDAQKFENHRRELRHNRG
jgi:hypothetical protein